jgi:hypothetical protein
MNFQFEESTYKFLKWVATVVLPAVATFYAGLGALWGWGNITPVVGTMTLTDTLLGSLLQLSSINYNKTQEDPAVVGATEEGEKNIPYDADAPPSHRKEN